jgi:hypothetical protein
MRFQVFVRWKIPGEEGVYSNNWMVKAVRGDCFMLCLDDLTGIEVRIPLAYVESMQMERKG